MEKYRSSLNENQGSVFIPPGRMSPELDMSIKSIDTKF